MKYSILQRNLLAALFTLAAMLCAVALSAQNNNATQTIRGSIVDQESKQPLIGATVVVVGLEAKGAASDANGEFKIEKVPVGRRTLKVSYIGYEPLVV
ncbi:MAG: carboxypeptidase-like regulatory domain-containing protein, partial [Bacteroidetes bacterium]|nr:carboxypeptidase-like regulatory domain-containing protein [Bacteroidota bacterium]